LEALEMIHPRIRFTFALGIALTNVVVAIAQESNPTSGAKNTSSAIEALDQLINRVGDWRNRISR
jgi:hypothetical protein